MFRAVLLGLALMTGAALAQTGNPAHDALAAQPEVERRSTLMVGLSNAGLPCSGVLVAAFAGIDMERNAYWDVRCRDGHQYRGTVAPARFTGPVFLSCGAAAPAPRGGPCFQPVSAAPPPTDAPATPAGLVAVSTTRVPVPGALATSQTNVVVPRGTTITGFGADREASCRAMCDPREPNRISACMAICAQGGDPDAPPFGSDPHMRFGAAYATPAPWGAVGFGNGMADRLAVNRGAAAACQTMAGRNASCIFQAEFVNQCGAVVQAIERSPRAMVITADINTFVAALIVTGTGATQRDAERMAMTACERQQNTPGRRAAGGGGPVCRVTASGC
ncbi:hypothetical protein ACE7GA_13215 [Roseomonas sp. CCTCC AB2023176]|uniref:hypothetical protein n=1 Tax=Roseomonas sp. CCTCC AB2023176 TaxID=3342640 RepID=UPI0035DDDB4F